MSAERVEIKDDAGAVMKLLKYDGSFFHTIHPELEVRLPKIKDMEGKDGDVVMVSFPKTGTNWISEMLGMLKQGNAESNWTIRGTMLELSPDVTPVLAQPEPRMFTTHLPVERLSESLLAKSKIVLVCRNPKDQAVSYMHHSKRMKIDSFDNDWNSFFGFWMAGNVPYGSYFDFYRNWNDALKKNGYKYTVVYYEDFHYDSIGTLRKLCDFLEYDRTDDLLAKITENCKLQTMQKTREGSAAGKMIGQKLTKDGSLPFFRKGLIGDWKNYFTVAQSEIVDRLMEEKLKDSMYDFRWDMPQ